MKQDNIIKLNNMNEMELKTKIEGLEKAIKEHDDFSQVYQSDLAKYEQELKDYNKPELTSSQMGDIEDAISKLSVSLKSKLSTAFSIASYTSSICIGVNSGLL